ncbi:MAG: insulinase family protein [Bacilli bacterium]|nr:insulinase family protein [Bacilli bacterium]
MIQKKYKKDTYNIYTIKTDKFKTCHMEIVFRNNINKDEVTLRSVLTEMLVETSKNRPTRKEMIIELENLYNSYFYGITNRIGNSVLTSLCFDFINPKLVNEDIDNFILFPLDTVFNPNVKDNEFDKTTLEYIKERVKKDIESIIEDPKKYSINKLLTNMCEFTASGIDINGNIEDLDLITPTSLYNYYNEMIKHDYIDIYIIGDLDMDYVSTLIENNLKLNIYKDHEITYEVENKLTNKPIKVYDNYDFSQENICIGLNIDNITQYEKNYVAHIYNMILGGGSLETKLYNRLRNENSLCYNCSSIYQKFDNLIILHTAISKENENLAIKLMKKALHDMIENLSEDEIENAKKLITTTLNMSEDVPGRIIDNYIFKNLYGLEDIEVRIKKYNNVTKKEIINFAKKVKLNTILCVRDGENGKD